MELQAQLWDPPKPVLGAGSALTCDAKTYTRASAMPGWKARAPPAITYAKHGL